MDSQCISKRLLAIGLIGILLAGCSTATTTQATGPTNDISALETDTPVLPTATDTSIPPSATATRETIPASEESIIVADFEFSIVQIAYDHSAFGLVPDAMKGNEELLFIEFNLISGTNEAFALLEPTVILESGINQEPVAWAAGTQVHTLTSMSFTGESSDYSSGQSSITLIYIVPKDPGTLLLEFPSGVLIDLTPIM